MSAFAGCERRNGEIFLGQTSERSLSFTGTGNSMFSNSGQHAGG